MRRGRSHARKSHLTPWRVAYSSESRNAILDRRYRRPRTACGKPRRQRSTRTCYFSPASSYPWGGSPGPIGCCLERLRSVVKPGSRKSPFRTALPPSPKARTKLVRAFSRDLQSKESRIAVSGYLSTSRVTVVVCVVLPLLPVIVMV